jgi:hypothetical protein
MVIVQHIETTWYKYERGAMNGTLRNKTPEAVAIPIEKFEVEVGDTILHTVHFERASTEIKEQLKLQTGKNIHIGSSTIEPSSTGATVMYAYDYRTGEKPNLWHKVVKTWTLNLNESCRIRFNARVVLESTWKYKITTVNIGVFDILTPDCFENNQLTYYFENMRQLR